MLKIRKVMNFFYTFRFVFIGIAAATATTITTLDLTKGNITEASDFEESYVYGEEISYSGSAFMGDVTFEFRKQGQGDDAWDAKEPHLVGKYEARGKSQGNHGYKYTKVSTFEIKPYETTINLLNTSIDFGNDHPALTYELLPGDSLNADDVKVSYDDLTVNTTYARIDLDSIKITDTDGNDITSCYTFTTEDKEITFNKAPLKVRFVQPTLFTYTGEEFSCNEFVIESKDPYYGAHVEYTGGISKSEIGKFDNNHEIRVIGEDGVTDYTANYDITLNDNYIEIGQAPAVTIKSFSKTKEYDGENFDEFDDPDPLITLEPGLISGHKLKIISYEQEDTFMAGTYSNRFEFDIVDADDNPVDRTLYKGISTVFGTLTINKRNLTLETKGTSFVFDNKYHSLPTFATIEGLADGDEVTPIEEGATSRLAPTSGVNNVFDYEIKRGEVDVKSCYSVSISYQQISITVTPLRFIFSPVHFEYDGQSHSYYYTEGNDEVYTTPEMHENAAVLDETLNPLPENWTYNVRVSNSFKLRDVKDLDNTNKKPKTSDVTVEIYDDSEPKLNVASYYNIGTDITFEMPQSSISTKRLDITVKDYEKEYNNKNLSEDVVINPNDPSTCVEYEGLVAGDLPDVAFLSGADKKDVNDGVDDEPYSISLRYGVKSSTGTNLTDNYDMHFENEKKTIDATITKKDIVLTPVNLYKTYDATRNFTPMSPVAYESNNDHLIGETVSLNNNLVGTYKTTDSVCGDYEYELDVRDINIKINGQNVTENYNIYFENKGNISITKRVLEVEYTDYSKPDSYVFYDGQEHGPFIKDNGSPSAEVKVSGLATGQKIKINNPRSTSVVDDVLDVGESEDLGITVEDSEGNDVSSNYDIYHTSFHIHIVQTKVTITPKALWKVYDGYSFEYDKFKNLNYNEFYDWSSSSPLKDAYNVVVESTVNGDKLQDGHILQFTKYKQSSATSAINQGSYPYEFDYRIIEEGTNNDVTTQYNISVGPNPITGDSPDASLCIDYARISVRCRSTGRNYNGDECSAPTNGEPFALTTNSSAAAYYINPGSNVGPKFFDRYSFTAQFDDGGYDPLVTPMYLAITYHFYVTITINDALGGSYGKDEVPSIVITLNQDTYDFTISKCQITLFTASKSATTGKELRRYEGYLAPGDNVYFGGVELLETNKRKVYTYDLDNFVIIHEADGRDVTTECYDATTR